MDFFNEFVPPHIASDRRLLYKYWAQVEVYNAITQRFTLTEVEARLPAMRALAVQILGMKATEVIFHDRRADITL